MVHQGGMGAKKRQTSDIAASGLSPIMSRAWQVPVRSKRIEPRFALLLTDTLAKAVSRGFRCTKVPVSSA